MTDIVMVSIITGSFSLTSTLMALAINRKQNKLNNKVDGLLEEKTKADIAIGKKAGKIEGADEQKEKSGNIASQVIEAIKQDPEIDVTKHSL